MMLGREIKLPIDLLFGRPDNEVLQASSKYASTSGKAREGTLLTTDLEINTCLNNGVIIESRKKKAV